MVVLGLVMGDGDGGASVGVAVEEVVGGSANGLERGQGEGRGVLPVGRVEAWFSGSPPLPIRLDDDGFRDDGE